MSHEVAIMLCIESSCVQQMVLQYLHKEVNSCPSHETDYLYLPKYRAQYHLLM